MILRHDDHVGHGTSNAPDEFLHQVDLASEIVDSLRLGDHPRLTHQTLRGLLGLILLHLGLLTKNPRLNQRASRLVSVIANPVSHGARFAESVSSSVTSTSLSLVADIRLADPRLVINEHFPSLAARSMFRFSSFPRLAAAWRLRRSAELRGAATENLAWLYREYLFLAQAIRYSCARELLSTWPRGAVVLTDFDRAAYTRPWVWAARTCGYPLATLFHGSPNAANYLPLLAEYALLWGTAQEEWIRAHAPSATPVVVGRADLPETTVRLNPVKRVLICHSREVLSSHETEAIVSVIARLDARTVLRLHPTSDENGLTDGWERIAAKADDVQVSRLSLLDELGPHDLVICVSSSSAVEALAVGIPAIVIADDARVLPCDLDVIRDNSAEVLEEMSQRSGHRLDGTITILSRKLVDCTGAEASSRLDAALLTIASRSGATK